MKTLIIGGAGFVGGHLIKHFTDLSWDVFVTKLPNQTLEGEPENIFDLDILNQAEIENILEKVKPDYIVNLAAQSSVFMSWQNPGLTVDINIKGCINILEAARKLKNKPRILLIGSSEEYGAVKDNNGIICEGSEVKPGNIYAASKMCQNILGKIYADAYDMDIIMVRAFNHSGPGQLETFVISDFCKQVAEIEMGVRETVMRVGNLSAKRDFTDVRDVVSAYSHLLEKGKKGEIYNVGSSKALKIQEILDIIISESDQDIKVEIDEKKFRPIDVPVIQADISKIMSVCGWKPQISLADTIKDTLDYWRHNVKNR